MVCFSNNAFILLSGIAFIRSVFMGVGPMAFTVMLKGANSFRYSLCE